MDQPKIETYQTKVKAIHRYEVVGGVGRLGVAGKKFHFIGAGGIGMSGLAGVLLKNKATVSGSDQTNGPTVEKLCKSGADIKIGHSAENLSRQIDAVVISAAIKEDNPELKLARQKGCKIYKYAEILGELMKCYEGIAVAGTHGKSTTAGWLAYCLKQAGTDPSFIIGADITQLGSSSAAGDGKVFVAEACEYDRSFLHLEPKIACILNIEADHLDYYKDLNDIVDAFVCFALGIKSDGVVIANGQDTNVVRVIRRLGADVRCETFGFDRSCNFSAGNIELIDGRYCFEVYHNDQLLGAAQLSLPGRHNILNALAVVAMWTGAGLSAEQILKLLAGFNGIDRRVMLKGQINQITVLDDYAHHPTEIRATLSAIRQRYNPRRLWCVFQPHQYSRTRFLLDDFAESFKLADITIVPEIYFVRDSEAEKKQVNSQMLIERIRNNDTEAVFIDGFGAIVNYLKENVTSCDLVVTMGAGDIWKVSDEYIQWLRANS